MKQGWSRSNRDRFGPSGTVLDSKFGSKMVSCDPSSEYVEPNEPTPNQKPVGETVGTSNRGFIPYRI